MEVRHPRLNLEYNQMISSSLREEFTAYLGFDLWCWFGLDVRHSGGLVNMCGTRHFPNTVGDGMVTVHHRLVFFYDCGIGCSALCGKLLLEQTFLFFANRSLFCCLLVA